MTYPDALRYSTEHEWLRLDSETTGTVGITEYAAEELGDVVFVELPAVGDDVTVMGQFGEIESVKAVSELYSPVSGEVIERNDRLNDEPELVNDSAYDDGWMIKVRLTDPSEVDALMTADQYEQFLNDQ